MGLFTALFRRHCHKCNCSLAKGLVVIIPPTLLYGRFFFGLVLPAFFLGCLEIYKKNGNLAAVLFVIFVEGHTRYTY